MILTLPQKAQIKVTPGLKCMLLIQPSSSIYKVWMREHNRVATELSKIQPDWADEKLYQEARLSFDIATS